MPVRLASALQLGRARVALAALAAALATLDGVLVALPGSVVTISATLLIALGLFALAALSLSVLTSGLVPVTRVYSIRELHGWYAVFDESGYQIAYCPTRHLARQLAAQLGELVPAAVDGGRNGGGTAPANDRLAGEGRTGENTDMADSGSAGATSEPAPAGLD